MKSILPEGSYPAIAGGMKTTVTHNNVLFTFQGENGVKGFNVTDIVNVTPEGISSSVLGACTLDSVAGIPALSPDQQRWKDVMQAAVAANTKLYKAARSAGCDALARDLTEINLKIKSHLFLLMTPEEVNKQREIDRYT